MPETEIAPGDAGPHDEQVSLRKLFEPVKVGPYNLRHRVVMAPLTRSRASRPGNIPSQLNACYYAQRAAAALIISEATQVSRQGQGYAWTPAYLHIVNPALAATGEDVAFTARAKRMSEMIRRTYRGVLMVAGGFDGARAERWLEDGNADLIAFGRLFIANPDLPERLWSRALLNSPDPSTFYGGGERGYTDYPSLAQERGEAPRSVIDGRWR